MLHSVITGSGSYIPPFVKTNQDFARHVFYTATGTALHTEPGEVVSKFRKITGIEERRYTTNDLNASDLGLEAGRQAIRDSGTDPETLDQLIVAHNFGNVIKDTIQTAAVPSLASLIKNALGIRNPDCVAYDILFGCPGWLQGLIQSDAYIKAGLAKKTLIIGTEALSRVIDMYDRDSMIFSDGAGAVMLEQEEGNPASRGIMGYVAQTYSIDEIDYINMGPSFYPESDPRVRYLKMKGRKVYEFAITQVPAAMKLCLEKSAVPIHELKKILFTRRTKKWTKPLSKDYISCMELTIPLLILCP